MSCCYDLVKVCESKKPESDHSDSSDIGVLKLSFQLYRWFSHDARIRVHPLAR